MKHDLSGIKQFGQVFVLILIALVGLALVMFILRVQSLETRLEHAAQERGVVR